MKKEEFLKELKYQLRYLNKNIQEEELKSYENLENYNLKPEEIANSIYQKRGLNIKVTKKTSLFDSISTIIDALKSKNKKILLDLLFFFLYMFILIILIKIPFIYVRDIISTFFNILVSNDTLYVIWNLTFELLYAITAILIFIKFIKNKAKDYENAGI
ncbi:unknown [Mycoplasma sp. CAG:776]|nr:unknown [Mycoplasma sp. CAG:776]